MQDKQYKELLFHNNFEQFFSHLSLLFPDRVATFDSKKSN